MKFKVSIGLENVKANFVATVEASSKDEAIQLVRVGYDEGIDGECTDVCFDDATLDEDEGAVMVDPCVKTPQWVKDTPEIDRYAQWFINLASTTCAKCGLEYCFHERVNDQYICP